MLLAFANRGDDDSKRSGKARKKQNEDSRPWPKNDKTEKRGASHIRGTKKLIQFKRMTTEKDEKFL